MEIRLSIFGISENCLDCFSLKCESYLLGYAYLLSEIGEQSGNRVADISLTRFPVLLRPFSTERGIEIGAPVSTGPTRYLAIPKSLFDYLTRKLRTCGSMELSLFSDNLEVSESSIANHVDKSPKKVSGTVRFITESERTSFFFDGLTSSCHEDPATIISQKMVQLIMQPSISRRKTSSRDLDIRLSLSEKQAAQTSASTLDQNAVHWLTTQIILETLSHQFARTCQNICDADLLVDAIEKDGASLIERLDDVLPVVTLYVGLSKVGSRKTKLIDGTYDCLSSSNLLTSETAYRTKLGSQTFAHSPTLTSILTCLALSKTECPDLSQNEKANVFSTISESLVQSSHLDIIQAHRLTKALSPMFGPIFEVFVAQRERSILEHGILSFAGLNETLIKAMPS